MTKGMVKVRLTGPMWRDYQGYDVHGRVVLARSVSEHEWVSREVVDDADNVQIGSIFTPSFYAAWSGEVVSEAEAGDSVEHPGHYNAIEGMPEVWDILDAFFPADPLLWNAGKYLLRAKHKGDEAEQLNKLKQYVDRRLEKLNAGTD